MKWLAILIAPVTKLITYFTSKKKVTPKDVSDAATKDMKELEEKLERDRAEETTKPG